ncbi:MAG: carbohydrate kinase family protein [Anaerolineae bacterium]|nr:carbohydrate kinase family protein [Anaerolineae bacterium]
MAQPYDILLLGDYFYDLIYTGLPAFPKLGQECYCSGVTSTGGAMFTTAAALRRLGAHVGWVTNFGTDEYSRFVRELSQKEGIDLAWARTLDAPYRRITSAMPYEGERAFLTYVDPDPVDFYEYWLQAVEHADYRHLHVGGLMPEEWMEPVFSRAKARGATVSMDCQDTPQLYSACDWAEALATVDIFMPNAREARMVTGLDDVELAARKLNEWVNVVVVKDGERGAWVAAEGHVWLVPGIHAGEVLDTTGAGDCFNAGFLYGRLIENAPYQVSARYGNICGGLSVTGVGGATAAPTYTELKEWLAKTAPATS